MAQTPCVFRQSGDVLDYTPGSAVLAGTVVVTGNLVCITTTDISATGKGSKVTEGVFDVPKDNSDVTAGDSLYWNSTGSPVGGTGGSGAFTKTVGANPFAGTAIETAGTGVGMVEMHLHSIDGTVSSSFGPTSVATVVVGGNVQANANAVDVGFTLVTGANDTAAVKLPTAAAGKICIIKNMVAAKILPCFPGSSDKINNAAGDAVYNIGNGAMRIFVAYNAVDWFTAPETENA